MLNARLNIKDLPRSLSPEREQAILELEIAATGAVDVHLWSGKPSPWMKMVIAWPGQSVDESGGFPVDFAKSAEVSHEGVLDAARIYARLEELYSFSPDSITP